MACKNRNKTQQNAKLKTPKTQNPKRKTQNVKRKTHKTEWKPKIQKESATNTRAGEPVGTRVFGETTRPASVRLSHSQCQCRSQWSYWIFLRNRHGMQMTQWSSTRWSPNFAVKDVTTLIMEEMPSNVLQCGLVPPATDAPAINIVGHLFDANDKLPCYRPTFGNGIRPHDSCDPGRMSNQ